MLSNRLKLIPLSLGLALLSGTQITAADPASLSLGAKLQIGTWKGSNDQGIGEDFESKGNQLGLNLTYQTGRYYFGLNLQGGEYNFDNGAPNINHASGTTTAINDVNVKRGESDLLVGYYFWERISLFLDMKQITNDWQNQNASLTYRGLGLGISGYHPLNAQWNLYGSFGLMPVNIFDGSHDIGNGGGSALEFGALYRVADNTQFNISLKSQAQTYEFENGDKQTHSLGGLVIGVTHRFPM